MSMVRVTLLPSGKILECEKGSSLQELLRFHALVPESYCGGTGKCGKCRILVDGQAVLACQTRVEKDCTVELPANGEVQVLAGSAARSGAACAAAFDIGTTTVVCYLLDKVGNELLSSGRLNPQVSYGADVVSRIRSAQSGTLEAQSELIRGCMCSLLEELCDRSGTEIGELRVISVVGNPAMVQLFLGMPLGNLISIPFVPVITSPITEKAAAYLPVCPEAELRILPEVSGYVGADTVACVLSTGMADSDKLTLLVDIGTNGEMVLGDRSRLLTCATAAGPALEGANIRCGMRGAAGAIDRVSAENGQLRCHVIGDIPAKGICGSGLIDAAAVFLDEGRLDRRGRILSGTELPLCGGITLSQSDIRELQAAKGAIAAGIELLAREYGAELSEIRRVLLAGAFGSFLSPESACRIGLLPQELSGRIRAVGNAAGQGAVLTAADERTFYRTAELAEHMEPVELAALPEFQRSFAKNMYFHAGNRGET